MSGKYTGNCEDHDLQFNHIQWQYDDSDYQTDFNKNQCVQKHPSVDLIIIFCT